MPKVVELLLIHVELNGLYTEGIYRKSGSTCRARELHQILETGKNLHKLVMHKTLLEDPNESIRISQITLEFNITWDQFYFHY